LGFRRRVRKLIRGNRFRAITIQDDRPVLLLRLTRKRHTLTNDFALTRRTVKEYRDDKDHDEDQCGGADNAFFQGSFHHD
jgi:hypothetical protein